MATALKCRSVVSSKAASLKSQRPARKATVAVRAQLNDESLTRRSLLGLVTGVGASIALARPELAQAAYGDAANVFGKITNKSGFVTYAGEGYALLLPAKWNPSKEKDFPGVDLRYEDNFDAVTNLIVLKTSTDKKSIEDYGSPEKFLESVSYLLGKQTFAGETISEGGFAPNKVSAASLLDISVASDKKGKKYYKFDILTRTADGDEGGRHQLISASVGSDGKLYVAKYQCGDKRWFKGARKEIEESFDSFTVA